MSRARNWVSCRLLFLVCLLLASLILVHYREKYSSAPCKDRGLVLGRNFEILPYPLHIRNAPELVSALRSGESNIEIPAGINYNYVNITYSPVSMQPCTNGPSNPLGILIMIETSLKNQNVRMKLRSTWANAEYLSKFDTKIKYAFIVGNADKSRLKGIGLTMSIMAEIEMYDDIIIGDFLDTYRNLTYKTMAGIGWALKFCPHFQFYVSLDDDVYLSVPNLINFLKDPVNYPLKDPRGLKPLGTALSPDEDFYSGHMYHHGFGGPIRNKFSKWYLSKEEYPLDVFPSYVAGYFVILSRETLIKFYHLSPYVQHLSMEDVYLGLMANKLGIAPYDITDVVVDGLKISHTPLETLVNGSYMRDYIAIHHVLSVEKRTTLWKQVHSNRDQ